MKKIAILYDGASLQKWQLEAVRQIEPDHELLFLVVENEQPRKRKIWQHAFYYLLNLIAIKRAAGKRAEFGAAQRGDRPTLSFSPDYDGIWAVLPPDVDQWLKANKVDAVVRFGLSLIRVAENSVPMISWHHGDPRDYRGRPAGFYEMRDGQKFVGQIVHQMTNTRDAGPVLAFAQSRVLPHSYRKTLSDAYQVSPLLIRPALKRLWDGDAIDFSAGGKNFPLPSNAVVIRALFSYLVNGMRRLGYGLFVEKRWKVSRVALAGPDLSIDDLKSVSDRERDWETLATPPEFTFLADPFIHQDGRILVEGLDKTSGKGKLAAISDGQVAVLSTPEASHYSYPSCFDWRGKSYVIPEMSQAGKQAIYRLVGDELVEQGTLDIDTDRLIDPTLFEYQGRVFLFANRPNETSALRLWSSTGLMDRFEEHPLSPIRVSARGSRMGGMLTKTSSGLLRFGQDFEKSYGDALIVFKINTLTENDYSESEVSRLVFDGLRGPHTLNLQDNEAVFDWYVEKFSPLAGARRVIAALQARADRSQKSTNKTTDPIE